MWLGIIAMGDYVWTNFKRQHLQIGLTDQRVIATHWANYGQQTVDMPLSKIESVIVDGKGRGTYGTLHISGVGNVVLRFENIKEPGKFRQAINEQLSLLQ